MDAIRKALEGDESVVLVDKDYNGNSEVTEEFEEIFEEYRESTVEFSYPETELDDLTGLGIQISEYLEGAIERDEDETYLLVLDPVKIHNWSTDHAAYRFLHVTGGYFNSANKEAGKPDFKAFYVTDSRAYNDMQWARLESLVDGKLDLEEGTYVSR